MDGITIRPGFRRPFTLTPAPAGSAFENPRIASRLGNSTQSIEVDGKGGARGFLNGDGALGANEGVITIDGHLGDGDVDVEIPFAYAVATPDATGGTLAVGDEEAIPDAIPA